MSESNAPIEWYLARDGQQHGPLSDAELAKFRELGHLRPNDLVWRAGFPEWLFASDVFPEQESTSSPPPAPSPAEPAPDTVETPSREHETVAEQEPAFVEEEQEAVQTISEDKSETQSSWQSPVKNEQPEVFEDFQETAAPQTQDQPVPVAEHSTTSASASVLPHQEGSLSEKSATPTSQPSFSQPNAAPAGRAPASQQPLQRGETRQVHPNEAPEQFHPMSDAGKRGQHPQFGFGPKMGTMQGASAANQANLHPHQHQHPDPRFYKPEQQAQGFAAHSFGGRGPAQPHAGFQHSRGNGPYQQAAQQARPDQSDPHQTEDDDFYDDYEVGGRPRYGVIIAVLLASFVCVSFSAWLIYANRNLVSQIVSEFAGTPDQEQQNLASTSSKSGNATLPGSTSSDFLTDQTIPAAPQKLVLLSTNFWRALRSYDPEWVNLQEGSIEKLKVQGKSDDERLEFIVNAIVDWRRSNADKILSAPPQELRKLARSFVLNLQHLASQNVRACYGFISKGELSPIVLPLYNEPSHLRVLETQGQAFVSALRNHSDTNTQYPQPGPNDFNALAQMLLKRGWSETDLEMFSDAAALSSAPAEKVCKLVTEWFDTQLQMQPSDQQMRLLATSLEPVVRG